MSDDTDAQKQLLNQILTSQVQLFDQHKEINIQFKETHAQIKEINNSLIILARVEERQMHDRGAIDRVFTRLKEHDSIVNSHSLRIQKLETKDAGNGKIFTWLASIAASAITSFIVVFFKSKH